jgi:hypothetical protein
MEKDPKVAAEVKAILKLIKELSPGNTVELRIPGYGAIQCVAGGNHRRGTPPNTVEMSGATLVKLINQPELWPELVASGLISASGFASDLSPVFTQAQALYEAK